MRPEHVHHRAGPATNEFFVFALRQLTRVNSDATFCATEWHVDECGLPCHQAGECANVV